MEILATVFLWLFKATLLIAGWEIVKAVTHNGIKSYIGW